MRSVPNAIRSVARLLVRAHVLWRYRTDVAERPGPSVRYLLRGRELSNFTYEIENVSELAPFIAHALGRNDHEVSAALAEIFADDELIASVSDRLATRADRERRAMIGRRAGWYCVVRLEKPRLIVETGTRDGLGSAVILRALKRNTEEGSQGRLMTFDVRPDSGWAIPLELRSACQVLVGDVRELLPTSTEGVEIDILIHDSHHTYEHETFEFQTAFDRRGSRLVLVSDNAHATTALSDFASEHGGSYAYFEEKPLDHFYPGGGIGLSVIDESADGRSSAAS